MIRSNYQRRDQRVVDYEEFRLPGTPYWVRGPEPDLSPGKYFACVGAAQTYGCFSERPFPALLGERLGLGALNLGFGGAGPAFFLRDERLLSYVDKARFVVVQVMSGRSADNSEFESGGSSVLKRRSNGQSIDAIAAWVEILREESILTVPMGRRQLHLFGGRSQRVSRLVEETRASWLRDTLCLLGRIQVPTVLLYFSKRKPRYQDRHWYVYALLRDFPHLVNDHMIEAVKGHADAYVECVTHRGSPQLLTDRETGAPVTIDLSLDRPDLHGRWRRNSYYPSPQMHEDAAHALVDVCDQFVESLPYRRSFPEGASSEFDGVH